MRVAGKLKANALFSVSGLLIGLGAHFYLVLIVALVHGFLLSDGHDHCSADHSVVPSPPPAHPVVAAAEGGTVGEAVTTTTHGSELVVGRHTESADSFSGWSMSLYVLVCALVLAAGSLGLHWTWPMLSEKALIIALLWLIYAVIAGALGFHGLVPHVFSLLWLLAALASLAVDCYHETWRQSALVVTAVALFLFLIAPWNACACLSTRWCALTLFYKITLFHLLWHSNRLLRVSESSLYDLYRRRVCAALEQLPHMQVNGATLEWSVRTPSDIVLCWDRLVALSNQGSESSAPLRHVASCSAQSLPGLTDFCTLHESKPWCDWKYRHYSHQYMNMIDTVRSAWIFGVCLPYALLALLELAWLWYTIHRLSEELVAANACAPLTSSADQEHCLESQQHA